jgi:hypothetical protein
MIRALHLHRHIHGRLALRAFILPLLVAAVPRGAAAQWGASVAIGAARFWGGSREVNGNRSFRPYRPTIFGIGLDRELLGFNLCVQAYYANASLALEGADGFAGITDGLDLHGVALEASRTIGRLGQAVTPMVSGGPVIELWDLADQSSSTHVGITGSLGLQIALGRRFTGVITAGVTVTGSPFSPSDLEAGFESRALWRRDVSGRLRYRL